jgi:hypothetical protein
MKGSRPEQAIFTKDNDLTKTAETQAVIESMVDGLNDHKISSIGDFFYQIFSLFGNPGFGYKKKFR